MNTLLSNLFYAVGLVILVALHGLDASNAQFVDLVRLTQSTMALQAVLVLTAVLGALDLAGGAMRRRAGGSTSSMAAAACSGVGSLAAARVVPRSESVPPVEDPASDDLNVDAIPAGYLRYFVSYSYVAASCGSGHGCIEIGRTETIGSQADIKGMIPLIEDTLQRRGITAPKVVILNWRPFEPPRPEDGARESLARDAPDNVALRLVA